MHKIVIIGGGLSGSLLAINLLKRSSETPVDITILDKDPAGTLGLAYSTDKPFHLLNVSAGKMSAFPAEPDDFIDWLGAAGYRYQAASFVPRKLYRAYIQERLAECLNANGHSAKYTLLNEEVVDILPSEQVVTLASGRRIPFTRLVLAVGNFKPADLPLPDGRYLDARGYFASAWEPRLFEGLPQDAGVLVLGTGLTMVDAVLTLREKRHKGTITAISTHGYTPMAHGDHTPYELTGFQPDDVRSSLEALQIVNRHLKEARQQGIPWHSVIDAIRPVTQQIWQGLPVEEKKRFMHHLRHIWGVARHRIPRESAALLYEMLSSGRLSIVAGRIKNIVPEGDNRFLIEYRQRAACDTIVLRAGAIVNCMGPQSDYEKLKAPLIRNLLKKGLIRTDDLHLGVDCTAEGIVIGKDGLPSPWLYTIGPPSRGCLWEITSVPEIRIAAARLAANVLSGKEALVC